MYAVCPGPAGCRWNSADRCKVASIETGCGLPMWGLSKLICAGNYPRDCPIIDAMFNYMNGWIKGECGAVDGTWCAFGKSYVSTSGTPLYAYCLQITGTTTTKPTTTTTDTMTIMATTTTITATTTTTFITTATTTTTRYITTTTTNHKNKGVFKYNAQTSNSKHLPSVYNW